MSEEIADGIYLHTCTRCKYKWTSKKEMPKTCANPECRSPYWSKPKKK